MEIPPARRLVSPDVSQLAHLRQPLTRGERLLFECFNDTLDVGWEIYVQPHLNGLRPDFVLLHPERGVAVFEVKDWNLSAMRYWTETNADGVPRLMANDGHTTFNLDDQNPWTQVQRYRRELYTLYCPRLQQGSGIAAITAGVVFPFASTAQVKQLLQPFVDHQGLQDVIGYHPVSGADALAANDLRRIFPEHGRRKSKLMSADLADDLRGWLVEPDASQTQRLPLELDAQQRSLVTTRTGSGMRRIRGPAGSGKSVVVAARAAELSARGQSVLVVSFNITLVHYLRDAAVRWNPRAGIANGVTWLNFHAWCRRVCDESGYAHELSSLMQTLAAERDPERVEQIMVHGLPALTSRCLDRDAKQRTPRYDAILVDEGQDFHPHWWNLLRRVCRPRGEMLLAADATQDVYGTARKWTDEAMTGAGFPGGRWTTLHTSYRLPAGALGAAREFAEQHLPSDQAHLPQAPQGELDLYPCDRRWVQLQRSDLATTVDRCVSEIKRLMEKASVRTFGMTDITFLTASQAFGLKVVERLEQLGIRVAHTYDPDPQASRRRKMAFYMGNPALKATTIHSFKGWESCALVVHVGERLDESALALVYTALTRLKKRPGGSHLTVVNRAPELQAFGSRWPEMITVPQDARTFDGGSLHRPELRSAHAGGIPAEVA